MSSRFTKSLDNVYLNTRTERNNRVGLRSVRLYYFIKEERQMHSKSKPGFIRLNTLALAAALALACTLALLFCGCQSKAEREKLAEEGLLYYKNLDFNNAKRCFLTCGDSYKYTEYLESIAEYEKLYAQAVELVSAGKC